MLAAGLLRLGAALRFVSNAVMVGFINAVGVNIVLDQLAGAAALVEPRGRPRDDRAAYNDAVRWVAERSGATSGVSSSPPGCT